MAGHERVHMKTTGAGRSWKLQQLYAGMPEEARWTLHAERVYTASGRPGTLPLLHGIAVTSARSQWSESTFYFLLLEDSDLDLIRSSSFLPYNIYILCTKIFLNHFQNPNADLCD